MVAPVTVSENDLRTLLGIVSDERDDLPVAGLPVSLLTDLMDQVPCDWLSFFGVDTGRQADLFAQMLPAGYGEDADEDRDQTYWAHQRDFAPCTYPEVSGDLRSITMVSDFYSARQFHSSGMYCDHYRPLGVEHHLRLCLDAGPGRTVNLMLFRGPGPGFPERDRALLALLRPHLLEAYRDAERRRSARPRLTPRQQDVLRLAAVGRTNAQIARRLGLSEGTVRIHLQNTYTRLGVSSRTAAVTCAFPDLTVT